MTTNLTLSWPFYSFLSKDSGRNTRSGGQDNASASSSSSSGLSQKPGAYAEGGDGGDSIFATSEEYDGSIRQPQEESYDNIPIEAELAVDDTVERRRFRQDDEIELVHAEPALDAPKGADAAELAENHRQSWTAQKRNKFILLLLWMLAVGLVLAVVLLFSSAENDPKPAPSSTQTATPTASPTISLAPTSFSDRFFNLLSTFTPENILQDSSAPQFQAFQWVIGNESEESSVGRTDEVTLERYALATLFFATDGFQWSSNNTFLLEESHCDWDGVDCTADKEAVESLSLPSENLSGTLPPEIGLLASLTSLNLTNQNATEAILTGPIPSEIGLLTSLVTLDISNNGLSGSIPSEIRNLNNIRTIALQNNRLEGFVPVQLGFLSNLEHLSLEKNLLTGGIPFSLCSPSFTSIQSISADCLSISDSIPSEVACRCCNLCCDVNDFCRDDLDVAPFPTFPPTDDDIGGDSCRTISAVSMMAWSLVIAYSITLW